MAQLQTLPDLWLLSDARNDAGLERALARLPRGSGFIFRHYHLDEPQRRARFGELARQAGKHRHVVILSADAATAQLWGADGTYGPAREPVSGLLHLATAHDMGEVDLANRTSADAVLISPVFATRSHPGGAVLGPVRFRKFAAKAQMPVIALGGMNAARARSLGWARWAAIDGLN